MTKGSEFFSHRREPLLIVIYGPSGVGKDSVVLSLRQRNDSFSFVVTATTRPPRENEVDGVDYFFVSEAKFAEMIDNDELLEYAIVYNDFKGIPRQQVREAFQSGRDVVMRLDVQGAETIRELCPEALLIFLTVQNEAEMVDRLMKRDSGKGGNMKLRIATARRELKRIKNFDYVVVNKQDRLDEAVDTILAIIEAEHHRVKPRKVSL